MIRFVLRFANLYSKRYSAGTLALSGFPKAVLEVAATLVEPSCETGTLVPSVRDLGMPRQIILRIAADAHVGQKGDQVDSRYQTIFRTQVESHRSLLQRRAFDIDLVIGAAACNHLAQTLSLINFFFCHRTEMRRLCLVTWIVHRE